HLVEGHVDTVHRAYGETGVDEILRERVVDIAREISRADEVLHLQRAQGRYVILAGGEDRRFVFLLPFSDEASFLGAAFHHERWRAVRMNGVAALLGEKRDLLLVGGHDGLELVARSAPN